MFEQKPVIDVLLATCNGGQFLEQQLDSLFNQTFQRFHLIVRDDCSSDATLSIVERFQSIHPGSIELHRNNSRQGACRNFSLLTQQSNAPYFAFCDQDDIWHPDKLERSLKALQDIEGQNGTGMPALVFTDVALVDEKAACIAPSMWRSLRVCPERLTFASQLVQNLVTGCTVLGNRSLLKLGSPLPEDARMHDDWLGLVATAFGVVRPLRHVTMDYRQHANNAIGTKAGWRAAKLSQLWKDPALTVYIGASQKQARAFATRYASRLSPEQKTAIETWSTMQQRSALFRHWDLYRHGLRRTGFWNNLGFMVRA